MKIIESLLIYNDCYKQSKILKEVKGFMLHSVGCPQPSANAFIKNWNKSGITKCVHGFIEPNGIVYQTLPFDMRGWHGSKGNNGSANDMYIGFEMTEPSTIEYVNGANWVDKNPKATKEFIMGTYNTAVELFAYLCKESNKDPLGKDVIISHSEGYKLGIASNHGDVEHIWSKFGLTMNKFRVDVKNKMEEDNNPKFYRIRKEWKKPKTQIGAFKELENAIALCDKNFGFTVYDESGVPIYGYEFKDKFKIGDKVLANGRVCVNSYGNNPGKKLINYRGTISHVVVNPSPKQSHIYCIDSLGWLTVDDLKRIN